MRSFIRVEVLVSTINVTKLGKRLIIPIIFQIFVPYNPHLK